jgi:signal peptidase
MSVAPTGARSIAGGWLTATLAAVGVAVLLPLATFLTASWLLGWQLQSVQSGSMDPTYPVGSLLVVAAIDPATVQPGSPIVFRDPSDGSRLVTHRVIAIARGESLAFITKGDANATADLIPVTADRVFGRPLWSVSHLGTLLEWLAWPRSLLLVLVPGALLVLDAFRARRVPETAGRDNAPARPITTAP